MKELKNMKGITLVSLVITIIVLIILAAVSINMTIGTDGIITRAKQAAENMEIAALEEQEMLNSLFDSFEGDVIIGDTVPSNKFVELKAKYDALNTEHTDFKTQIAEAITNKGVETSSTDSVETMVSKIGSISAISDNGILLLDNSISDNTWSWGASSQEYKLSKTVTLPTGYERFILMVDTSSGDWTPVPAYSGDVETIQERTYTGTRCATLVAEVKKDKESEVVITGSTSGGGGTIGHLIVTAIPIE